MTLLHLTCKHAIIKALWGFSDSEKPHNNFFYQYTCTKLGA